MRNLIILVFLSVCSTALCAQPLFRDDSGEFLKTNDLKKFSEVNEIDSAFYTIHSSAWVSSTKTVLALILKNGSWYGCKMTIDLYTRQLNTNSARKVDYSIKKLDKRIIDSVFRTAKTHLAFKYSQVQIDSLPTTCHYKMNGEVMESSISDAPQVYLFGYNKSNYNDLLFYAPDFFLNKCPNEQYEIVRPFYETCLGIRKLVENQPAK